MSPASKAKADRKSPATGRRPASGRSRKKGQERNPPSMGKEELLAAICHYFCREGLSATQIQRRVEADHSEKITRERAYREIRKAARRGWIRFNPPHAYSLERQLKEKLPWLQDVNVVETARSQDVAHRGAEMLSKLLQQHYPEREVHIGFSGGSALRMFSQRFAELLRESAQHLPSKIVFHALVAGFEVYDPTTDPNAFFIYFVRDPAMEVDTQFVALHSPAMAGADLEEKLRALPGIEEAYARAGEIDIIVTSASCWKDEHSMLRHHMDVAGESVEELEKAGCLGDMLWQPIGPEGPFELKTRIRAMTIMELSQVSEFVAQRKHVLLVAGPCTVCHRPKTEVVRAILDQEHRLITHLVVDSRCARALM